MRRLSVALIVVSALCLLVSAQPQNTSVDPVEVTYRGSAVEWAPLVPMEASVLTVSGPDRFYLRQNYRSGARPGFAAVDEQGLVRPDGTYRWELVVELPAPEPDGRLSRAASGTFLIKGGRIVPLPEGESALAVSGGPVVALSTEGNSNNFFGTGAGAVNTGTGNSFFGASAGLNNTEGLENSFFGYHAGRGNNEGGANSFFGSYASYSNTAGDYNSSFGSYAGNSNTVEFKNTFVGSFANLDPGPNPVTNPVENATAIGYSAYVSQSNSLVLGSIAGVNMATSNVNVGIGTPAPARQLHLKGNNAVFRMDRSVDTAAFLLVRTDPTGVTPWKTFVVGTNASGEGKGEFIINDVGTAVGGLGARRMTITDEGAVEFTGTVSAAGFIDISSRALKANVRTYENALATVNRLRGVRFDWKDSGKPAVGLIAEEVAEVLPEVVAQENGTARGVSYANLVAVLVEAVKEQQQDLESLKAEVDRLKALLAR